MTSWFISDLHLDDARPEATEAFVRFCAERVGREDRLYILGDLFEYWIGDDHARPLADTVAEALAARHAAGADLYFMAGNRDFLLGAAYARRCGMRLLTDPAVILLGREPVVLSHGDRYCIDDRAYQTFRREVRDPAWMAAFLARPLEERLAFARDARAASRRETAAKDEALMDVNPAAVGREMRRLGKRLLIHGHTHRPAVHGAPAEACRRIVLGDWYEQGTIARADDASGPRLIRLGRGAP